MNQESQSCCPVCTLYLRPGISLPAHLNTHPKKHVIKALLTLTNQAPNVSKEVEQSEGNISDDSSSASSVLSCRSVTFNALGGFSYADRNNANGSSSPKSQHSPALSELLRNDFEGNEDDDVDIEDDNVNFENYHSGFEENQPDGTLSYQGESNESIQHHEESEETGSSMAGNFNNDPYQSNENLIANEGYVPRYFYPSENARISHTDPDPQLHPPQYSTLSTMELHPEYLSSNNQEHQLTLDIQTDELMPAHGELSGQESLEPPEPILASIWTMKSGEESQPHTSTASAWDDTVHEVSTAARNLMSLKNREEITKEDIEEKKEIKPLIMRPACPYCKLKFDGVLLRKAHIDKEHRSEEGVKKGLMYLKPLLTKVENNDENVSHQNHKVECGICNQGFDDYVQMTLHFIDTHKGNHSVFKNIQ